MSRDEKSGSLVDRVLDPKSELGKNTRVTVSMGFFSSMILSLSVGVIKGYQESSGVTEGWDVSTHLKYLLPGSASTMGIVGSFASHDKQTPCHDPGRSLIYGAAYGAGISGALFFLGFGIGYTLEQIIH